MDEPSQPTITFRCPPELEAVLPRPFRAVEGLPDWFKTLPHKAFSSLFQHEQLTVKKCPPFIDAMTSGFLMPLVADLRVEAGEFSWDQPVPGGALSNYPRSPIDFHDNNQVAGTPFFDVDRFVIKFTNFWTIGLPAGYSLLVTHPFNRADLPFHTLTGLVDCDRYQDNFVSFPARWLDLGFTGVLPRGTPVAQCIPYRRETWDMAFEILSDETAERFRATHQAIQADHRIYRRRFRAPKDKAATG
jgi:hypothetical protein